MLLCAISVDLDEIWHYAEIHGLGHSDLNAVYDVALPRVRAFADALAVPLTLFVVGADLDRGANVDILRDMVSRGHEIGNHSQDHWYDLARREPSEQRRQVELANERIETALGVRPKGFRAPGYTVSDGLLDIVENAGLSYDSSVFPCPAYYAAKALALLGMKLRSRRSKAVLDSPGVLLSPSAPYRVGKPYRVRGGGLLELPIQVAGALRLPFIGTSLMLTGQVGAGLLTHAVVGQPFVNLELHGLDFLDGHDVRGDLARAQVDLRVPWSRKRAILQQVVDALRSARYQLVRLDAAAASFA